MEEEVLFAGRYTLGPPLGRGGAGVVVRARDRELDRDVAIKFVRLGGGGSTEPRKHAQRRLIREAQAAAKLSHPNVVVVYDVGSAGDDVFIAMELVEGTDLQAWLGAGPRSWREILDVFLDAGDGLAAAHAASIVHRDFKPSNVRLGDDGRVRVLDFGLAKRVDDSASREVASEDVGASARPPLEAVDMALTEVGTVMGTPTYMAPEQHFGRAVTPQTDQYAFCVSLHQALCGVAPFVGRDLAELATAKTAERLAPAPEASKVPQWLLATLRRGMRALPENRWPSMPALLARLRARRRARWRWLGAAALAGMATAGYIATTNAPAPVAAADCDDNEAWLRGRWDDRTRETARAAFLASGHVDAADTWSRVQAIVDERTGDWIATRREICTTGGGDPLLQRRLACLQARKRSLAAQVDLWTTADATAVGRAVRAASGLEPAADCRAPEGPTGEPEPPADPASATEAEAIRDMLAAADAALRSTAFDRARTLVGPALTRAEALGYPPVLAEALLRRGVIDDATGDAASGLDHLSRAYFYATDHGLHRTAFAAAASLAHLEGARRADDARADEWIRHARVALERGRLGPMDEARLAIQNGFVLHRAQRHAEAEKELRSGLALQEARLGADDILIASTLSELAGVLTDQGRFADAQPVAERALSIRERVLGPEHRDVASSLQVLAEMLAARGEDAAALVAAERALAITERAVPAGHRSLAPALIAVGNLHRKGNRPVEARASYERALEVYDHELVADHPDVGAVLTNLGNTLNQEGDHAAAVERFDAAIRLLEAAVGSTDVRVAIPLYNRGIAQQSLGHHEAAFADVVRAESIWSEAQGPEFPALAQVLATRGTIEQELGRYEDAIEHFEHAIAIATSQDLDPAFAAYARWKLATTLWEDPSERPRARELAAAALAGYDAHASDSPEYADVQRWVREHDPGRG